MSEYGCVHVWGGTAMAYRKLELSASADPLTTLERVLAVLDERTQRLATLEAQLAETTANVDAYQEMIADLQASLRRVMAERDDLRTALKQVAEALAPFIAENAPSEEREVTGTFWRTVAVTREEHAAGEQALALVQELLKEGK